MTETIDRLTQLVLKLPGGPQRAERGEQRELMRRRENEVIAHQLRAYWDDVGSAAMPYAPSGPFSCECRQLGCDSEASASADTTLLGRTDGPFITHTA